MRIKNFILLALLTIGFDANGSLLSSTSESYEESKTAPSNISEKQFDKAVLDLQQLYSPLAKTSGGKLKIEGRWESSKLNAGAARRFGKWRVFITGAVARRPELTLDGLTLILCHELGHHFAGFPFAKPITPISGKWAATEGQSDYFATQSCAKKIWKDQLELNAKYVGIADTYAVDACNAAWVNPKERNLCYRTVAATKSMISTMAAIKKVEAPRFETPDQTLASATLSGHPSVQCRLDTAFQGALCTIDFTDTLIPGSRSAGGVDSLAAEQESSQFSCTQSGNFELGRRPACWFKARM